MSSVSILIDAIPTLDKGGQTTPIIAKHILFEDHISLDIV